MSTAALLAAALLLDAMLGEPAWLWSRLPHPAVLMGRAVAALDHWLNRDEARGIKGALALALLALGALTLGQIIGWLGPVADLLTAAVLLAQRSLAEHVRAVAGGLRQSLPAGREMVARIVSRDTRDMDAPQIARAAIESAAENLSDGVIAPAFWFLILGTPGLILYKAVNTADSMIGYRTPRYEAFGKAAARADDLMNLIPARLTGLLIALFTGQMRRWSGIVADARRHKSPNAGWPEAAMARALDVSLAGPRSYDGRMRDLPWVNRAGRRRIGAAEIEAATRLLWRVWMIFLLLIVACALLLPLR
ncbi:adenosylcobinamide-phosphate synthase CbiB [Antarcticimicrobium luteum]|uniref:Cobalamin biosynthesis protein CobD n=1 Tax=Antarcticimicrobium luteum TaxID=2547397 RepID=A0A4R5V4N7_9RHOB|nr:adenosylcobinamide-phosphate synthase CbiB [Antarcticimicrobium luteum]TDK46764.1 cobalamin biosynthesis protein [Antarcticimicrobium luteum]